MKILTQYKKALFDYSVLDTLEAGMVLTGDEVKSLRAGHVSLIGSFAHIKDGELYLVNASITPYKQAYIKREDQIARSRKLLVHKREIAKLIGLIAQKGATLIPLKIYVTERGKIKLELGICKHKKAPDRKQELKERDINRQTRRELKGE